MNPRAIRLLLVLSAFLAGLVLCFAVVLLVTGRGSTPMIAAPSAIGGSFRLTDQNGKTITDQDLKGRPFLLVAAVAGVLIAGTLALWAHYGTAVFFEMIAAGIAACF